MKKSDTKEKFKMLSREDRGKEIYEREDVFKITLGWRVKSQTGNRSKSYEVKKMLQLIFYQTQHILLMALFQINLLHHYKYLIYYY